MIIILFSVQGSLYVKMIKTALFNSRDKLLERVLKPTENNSSFHPCWVIYTVSNQKWIWLLDTWQAPFHEKLEPQWVAPRWPNSWKEGSVISVWESCKWKYSISEVKGKKWIVVIYINSYWLLCLVKILILEFNWVTISPINITA